MISKCEILQLYSNIPIWHSYSSVICIYNTLFKKLFRKNVLLPSFKKCDILKENPVTMKINKKHVPKIVFVYKSNKNSSFYEDFKISSYEKNIYHLSKKFIFCTKNISGTRCLLRKHLYRETFIEKPNLHSYG